MRRGAQRSGRIAAIVTLLMVGVGSLEASEIPAFARRYKVSCGAGYLLRRNVRVTGEATHDLELGGMRWTLGVVSAF